MVTIKLNNGSIFEADIVRLIPIVDSVACVCIFSLSDNPRAQIVEMTESLNEDSISSFEIEGQHYSASLYEIVLMISDEYQYIQLVLK